MAVVKAILHTVCALAANGSICEPAPFPSDCVIPTCISHSWLQLISYFSLCNQHLHVLCNEFAVELPPSRWLGGTSWRMLREQRLAFMICRLRGKCVSSQMKLQWIITSRFIFRSYCWEKRVSVGPYMRGCSVLKYRLSSIHRVNRINMCKVWKVKDGVDSQVM